MVYYFPSCLPTEPKHSNYNLIKVMTEVNLLNVCFFSSVLPSERRCDALVKTKPNQEEDKEKILCSKVPCLHSKYIRIFCVLVPPIFLLQGGVYQCGLGSKWMIFVIVWGGRELNYWRLVFHQGEIKAAHTCATHARARRHTHTHSHST